MFSDDHAVNDLVLCTVNTGSLYATHCRLAKLAPFEQRWLDHVLHRAIPEFRKSGGTHEFGLAQLANAAVILRNYYADHLTEL